MASLTASKRMLNNIEEQQQSTGSQKKGWSINNNRYEAIVIGDPYCGKSSYLNRLAATEKENNLPITISQDKNEFEFWVEHKSIKAIFNVKDTANQEKHKSLTQNYYRKAEFILLFFNLNSYDSFENLHSWYQDVLNYSKKPDCKFSIVLIGLKKPADSLSRNVIMEPAITQEMVEKFQQEHSYIVDYCEVDLTDTKHLKEPFNILIENILNCNESRILPTSYFENTVSGPKFNQNLLDVEKKRCKAGCLIV